MSLHDTSQRNAAGAAECCPGAAELEQWAGMVGGGLLMCFGLRRLSFLGGVVATIGGGILYRSAAAWCDAHSARNQGFGTAEKPHPAVEQDEVDEASWESFPASDPPSFTQTTIVSHRKGAKTN